MKRIAVALACTLFSAIALAQAPDLASMDVIEKSVPGGPVAVVDGKEISSADYLNLYRSQLAQLSQMAGVEKVTDELRFQAGIECLRRMVRERILLNEAAKRNITVSDAEVEAEFNEQLASMQEAMLKQNNEQLTEQQFLEKAGMTRAQVLASAKQDMIVSKTRDALVQGKEISIPDADVKKFYDSNAERFSKPGGVHLQQVFLRPEGGDQAGPAARDAARKAAEKALSRVRAGESVDKVAREVSNAPDAERGGHVAVPSFENLPPFYQGPVRAMKPGELSEVIESPHGYHFFLYISNKDEEKVPLEQAQDNIRNLLERVKEEDMLDDYLRPIEMDPERVQVYLDIARNMPASMRDAPEAQ
jgi:parvulin-like peptidyl-prolyl isomerase